MMIMKPNPPLQNIPPFTRRLFQLPPLQASSSSPSHSSLHSFLEYATRTNLPQTSSLYQGTHYEYTVQEHLRTAAFNLHRVGGRSDLGIDLTGTWHAARPVTRYAPVRVVVQCKALKTKIGPHVVRELEGVTAAFAARPSTLSMSVSVSGSGSGPGKVEGGGGGGGGLVAGVLVSPREATRGVREALGRSRMPLVWMMVERDGKVRQVLWNGRVEGELGMAGLGVEVRYSSEGGKGEVGLTWEGREVQTMDEVEEEMRLLEERWMEKWAERGLDGISKEEVLDAVERVVPGGRPLTISDEETAMVVKSLLSS